MNSSATMKIVGAVIVLASITGGAYFLEDRYARSQEVADVSQRLSVHVIQDQINFLQRQLWAMEDRCGNDISRMTQDQRVRYREMQKQKADLERQLNQKMRSKQ